MSSADLAGWHDLYVMAGGAAAVLTGLIFVAVSLHLRPMVTDRWLRGRAESSLLALMTVVLMAGAVLIPGQSVTVLGAEIVVLALASPVHSLRGLRHLPAGHRVGLSVELGIGLVGALLAIAGGIVMVLGRVDGLWLLLPGGAVALSSSVWNAWRLMVDVGAGEGQPS
jgi:hypothetical protein